MQCWGWGKLAGSGNKHKDQQLQVQKAWQPQDAWLLGTKEGVPQGHGWLLMAKQGPSYILPGERQSQVPQGLLSLALSREDTQKLVILGSK